MSKQIIILSFLIVLFFSCKEEKKNDDTSNLIVSRIVKDIDLSGGTIQRIDNFPSKFIKPRNVDVWLPDSYTNQKKYAVLYMHDGQMLFDATKTWNKQEWKVDEIVSNLLEEEKIKDIIVVAIWNIPEIRFTDYYPKKSLELLPKKVRDSLFNEAKKRGNLLSLNDFQADNYLKFMVDELKPYIDKHYSTLTDYKSTFIAGSSMGGLISMYAICEYPEIFGGAACISTHWPGVMPSKNNPIPASIFEYMKQHVPSPQTHIFYFDYGTETLDQYYPQYLETVDSIFFGKGYTEKNYMNLEFEGADHSEESWNRRFDIPLTFLLKKLK
jgi:enterochelin esterase-like enzyme